MANSTATCPVCNAKFQLTPGRGRPRRYCSTSCRRWYARHLGGSPCSIEGCQRPRTADGLCPAHYVHQNYPNRHGRREVVACTGCGREVEKSASRARSRRPVCSTRCRYFITYGKWPIGKELVGPIQVEKPTSPPVLEVPATRRGFLAAECAWCGAGFIHDWRTTGVEPRYCDAQCRRRAGKARRKLASGRFDIPRRDRLAIYERDNWTCQLCHEPVDPEAPVGDLWSATLDHIIPQSQSPVPDHSPANLRLAHLWCNSVRGDESYYTAADLVVA